MEGNDALLIPHPYMVGLYGLFRLTRYYNINNIRARVEFKTLDTLTPVWSHSQGKKPCILKRHLLCINYQVYVENVDSITPNTKLKSVLKTFVEAHSICKCFLFGRRQPGALVQAGEASWYSQKRVIHLSE